MSKVPEHTLSSGNVFADLGLANAPELQAKADLALEISRAIEERGLTQQQAADLLGIDQPKISAMVRGRLSGFSMERLYRFLNALGKDVEIVVGAPAPRRKASVQVVRSEVLRKPRPRQAASKTRERHRPPSK